MNLNSILKTGPVRQASSKGTKSTSEPTIVLLIPCIEHCGYLPMLEHNKHFGLEAVYVMCNWSSSITRFYERSEALDSVGCFKKLEKACERKSLETFRMADNMRPHRRRTNPRGISHGLLRCTNQNCRAMTDNTNIIVPRLWNLDKEPCLNIVDIFRSLPTENGIPPRFRRV
ncbi:uncharacterized protein EV154DRAFT_488261 [Mucor mucedo]|nr:uncharacterized protein EV154DRAFT_488261 [Mucor mucedo]KAI7867762.1 hypothetical protein EV154DRAFT_488261 [Mucor mucedo]